MICRGITNLNIPGISYYKKDIQIVPLTKTIVTTMQINILLCLFYLNTTSIIITAALGSAVGQMVRNCCDSVVHGSGVWTWLHR